MFTNNLRLDRPHVLDFITSLFVLAVDASQSPFGLGSLGGLSGLSGLGMGSANFMEMQQQIQSNMMSNPDFMRQVMDSPLTQAGLPEVHSMIAEPLEGDEDGGACCRGALRIHH